MYKDKIKEFVKENKDEIGAGLLGGTIAGVSYLIGVSVTKNRYAVGLNALCLADPELKGRITDAMKIVKDRIG